MSEGPAKIGLFTLAGPKTHEQRPTTPTASHGITIQKPTIKISHPNESSPKVNIEKGFKITPPRSTSMPLTQPKQKVTIQKAGNENCPFCESYSSTYTDVLSHIIVGHRISVKSLFKSPSFTCIYCNTTCESESQFVKHCIDQHEKNILFLIRDNITSAFEHKREDIVKFLSKKCSNINETFHRTYEISSSDSEEAPMAEDNQKDDEYFSFIASTINADGLKMTPSNSMNILNPSMIETTQQVTEFNHHDYIMQLHSHELFLRRHNLLRFNSDSCLCGVCNRKFETSALLMEHCYDMHKVLITTELRKICMWLDPSISKETSDSDMMDKDNLHLHFTLFPQLAYPDIAKANMLMTVPHIIADFIIEILSLRHLKIDEFETPKRKVQDFLLMINMPVPFPIHFTSESEDKMRVGFMSTVLASDEETKAMFKEILNSFAKRMILEAHVENIDLTGFDDLKGFAERHGVYLLKSPDILSFDQKSRSFSIYIMANHWTDELETDIKRELDEMKEKAKLAQCRKCKNAFNPEVGGECSASKMGALVIKLNSTPHEADPGVCPSVINYSMHTLI